MRLFMLGFVLLLTTAASGAQTRPARCGQVVTVTTHEQTTTRYALSVPDATVAPEVPRMALVLLVGGDGHLKLSDEGCPKALKGNSLVRSIPLFRDAGFITALVDAPSDHQGEDGLGGFRAAAEHAQDLGTVIADVRARIQVPVWVVGTSRGSISAANAAARLTGANAPDGVVLTSALMWGTDRGRKAWTAQTVFDLPLESIHIPLLVLGHEQDKCMRSQPTHMDRIAQRVRSTQKQVVTITGGPGNPGPVDLSACEGSSPHGLIEQEAEVAAGIARFIRAGKY